MSQLTNIFPNKPSKTEQDVLESSSEAENVASIPSKDSRLVCGNWN